MHSIDATLSHTPIYMYLHDFLKFGNVNAWENVTYICKDPSEVITTIVLTISFYKGHDKSIKNDYFYVCLRIAPLYVSCPLLFSSHIYKDSILTFHTWKLEYTIKTRQLDVKQRW